MRLSIGNTVTLMHAAIIGCLACTAVLHAQDTSHLVYDVSTVRAHHAGDDNMSWNEQHGVLEAINVDLRNLIADAWGVRPDQVAGEPAWADDAHWDVTGKVTDANDDALKKLTQKDSERMAQTLLIERFHAKVHVETRSATVFNLVPAKNGIKLKAWQPTDSDTGAKPPGTLMLSSVEGGGLEMTAKGVGIPMLIGNIAVNLQQTVIDKTGLPPGAVFDFTLRFAREIVTGTSQNGDAPSMREALEQQLGLHLETTRGPVQTVVVDQVEKPTAN